MHFLTYFSCNPHRLCILRVVWDILRPYLRKLYNRTHSRLHRLFFYKSCMDKLHSGIVGIAHCRHHFRQIMFPCKIRNRTFCKFIIDWLIFFYGATFISKSSHLSHFFLDKAKDQYISFLFIGLLQSTNFKFLNAGKNKLSSISSISARDVFSLHTT